MRPALMTAALQVLIVAAWPGGATPPQSSAVAVGRGPEAVVSDGRAVWVAGQFSNTLTKVDPDARRVLGTVDVGSTPVALAFDGTRVWVANLRSDNVMAVDVADARVSGVYDVGGGPGGLAFDGEHIWVANRHGRSVTKLRAMDGSHAGTFPVGRRPLGIVADGGSIWVTNNDDKTVTKLRATDGAQLGTYPVGDGPFGIAADGSSIWVTNFFDNTVTRLRAATGAVLGVLDVGDSPASILSEGGLLAVSNTGDDTVMILRPDRGPDRDGRFNRPAAILATLMGVPRPFGLALTRTAATATLWVASFSGDTVVPLQPPAGLFVERHQGRAPGAPKRAPIRFPSDTRALTGLPVAPFRTGTRQQTLVHPVTRCSGGGSARRAGTGARTPCPGSATASRRTPDHCTCPRTASRRPTPGSPPARLPHSSKPEP